MGNPTHNLDAKKRLDLIAAIKAFKTTRADRETAREALEKANEAARRADKTLALLLDSRYTTFENQAFYAVDGFVRCVDLTHLTEEDATPLPILQPKTPKANPEELDKNELLAALIKHRERQGHSCGVVVFSGASGFDPTRVAGWLDTLRNPDHFVPGVVAIDENDDAWLAVGGDDDNGAARWEPITWAK